MKRKLQKLVFLNKWALFNIWNVENIKTKLDKINMVMNKNVYLRDLYYQ